MKEKTLVEMKNKVDALERMVERTHIEIQRLTDLAFGTSIVMKEMPGYSETIEKLKNKNNTEDNDSQV